MIIREDKGLYNLVKSDAGKKIRIKGHKEIYSEATELKDNPIDFEEVAE